VLQLLAVAALLHLSMAVVPLVLVAVWGLQASQDILAMCKAVMVAVAVTAMLR
jgi:hypothetical protein